MDITTIGIGQHKRGRTGVRGTCIKYPDPHGLFPNADAKIIPLCVVAIANVQYIPLAGHVKSTSSSGRRASRTFFCGLSTHPTDRLSFRAGALRRFTRHSAADVFGITSGSQLYLGSNAGRRSLERRSCVSGAYRRMTINHFWCSKTIKKFMKCISCASQFSHFACEWHGIHTCVCGTHLFAASV